MKSRRIAFFSAEQLRHPLSSYCVDIEGSPTYFTSRGYIQFLEDRLSSAERYAQQMDKDTHILEERLLNAAVFSFLQAELYQTETGPLSRRIKDLDGKLKAAGSDLVKLEAASRSKTSALQGEVDYRGKLADHVQARLTAERQTTSELRKQIAEEALARETRASETASVYRELDDANERFRTAHDELARTVEDLHGYSLEHRELGERLGQQTARTRQSERENTRLSSELATRNQRITDLEVRLSNLTGDKSIYQVLSSLSQTHQRYAAEFLRAAIPPPRNEDFRPHNNTRRSQNIPRDFERFLRRFESLPYVYERFWEPENSHRLASVSTGRDQQTYCVYIFYSDRGKFGAKVTLRTTAQTPLQAEFVKVFVENLIK